MADELDEGFFDEEAERTLGRQQVDQGEDGEQQADDEARHQLHHPVPPSPAREPIIPQCGQQLLAVWLGDKLLRGQGRGQDKRHIGGH